mmetsp:Transcript_31995/g.73567  ORF Transcript_31995/g.73567 Transcript_31995/m.73567 type:complete len:311 (-) Transcript_31995:2719-3651(-)
MLPPSRLGYRCRQTAMAVHATASTTVPKSATEPKKSNQSRPLETGSGRQNRPRFQRLPLHHGHQLHGSGSDPAAGPRPPLPPAPHRPRDRHDLRSVPPPQPHPHPAPPPPHLCHPRHPTPPSPPPDVHHRRRPQLDRQHPHGRQRRGRFPTPRLRHQRAPPGPHHRRQHPPPPLRVPHPLQRHEVLARQHQTGRAQRARPLRRPPVSDRRPPLPHRTGRQPPRHRPRRCRHRRRRLEGAARQRLRLGPRSKNRTTHPRRPTDPAGDRPGRRKLRQTLQPHAGDGPARHPGHREGGGAAHPPLRDQDAGGG